MSAPEQDGLSESECNGPCRCEEGAYLGAQMAGTPLRCERCRGLVDEEASAHLDRLHAESLARLMQCAEANPLATSPTADNWWCSACMVWHPKDMGATATEAHAEWERRTR